MLLLASENRAEWDLFVLIRNLLQPGKFVCLLDSYGAGAAGKKTQSSFLRRSSGRLVKGLILDINWCVWVKVYFMRYKDFFFFGAEYVQVVRNCASAQFRGNIGGWATKK